MNSLREHVESLLDPAWKWRSTRTGLEAESPGSDPGRRLLIDVRADGDVDARVFIDGIDGSPFEQVFVVHDEEAVGRSAAVIADFVNSFTAACIVLVWVLRLARWAPVRAREHHPQNARWVASWRGTYDRGLV
jgi:hypothetical protein